jgi:hypothetical protein
VSVASPLERREQFSELAVTADERAGFHHAANGTRVREASEYNQSSISWPCSTATKWAVGSMANGERARTL